MGWTAVRHLAGYWRRGRAGVSFVGTLSPWPLWYYYLEGTCHSPRAGSNAWWRVQVFYNLGEGGRRAGTLSAYSVFNNNFQSLPGQLKGDHIVGEIRGGVMGAAAGGHRGGDDPLG